MVNCLVADEPKTTVPKSQDSGYTEQTGFSGTSSIVISSIERYQGVELRLFFVSCFHFIELIKVLCDSKLNYKKIIGF